MVSTLRLTQWNDPAQLRTIGCVGDPLLVRPHVTEGELIRRSQAGDWDAFELLLERHRTALARTAYLVTRDSDASQDVMQEALIQIWRDLPSYRPFGGFGAWLLKITLNKARKHYRKRRVQTVPIAAAAEVSSDAEGPEEKAERGEQAHRIRQALELLTSDHREVLVLRYYNELTVPEIARVLGRREGTVKSRLSRAHSRLGQVLSEPESAALGS